MFGKLKNFWLGITPHDRKLIKWTALVCYLILMVTLVMLFLFARHAEPVVDKASAKDAPKEAPPEPATPSEASKEHAEEGDSTAEPPPPPSVPSAELLAGLDSFDTRAHRELASIYAERQDYEKSIEHARRIAPWLEEDLEFQGQIGKTFLSAGDPSEAVPHLAKALKLGGKNVEIEADLALAKFRAQGPDSGLASIHQAMQDFPSNPLLMTHEAAMFGEGKDKGDAGDKMFRKLVQQFPHFAEARYQYGRFLMNQGNYASSLNELQQALKLNALDPRVHARQGMALFHLGRDAEAEVAYKTALAMNPKDYNTWYNLGDLHLSIANESDRPSIFSQRTRAALEAYLTSLANHPDHPEAHYRVGVILSANKQYREAILHLQQALQADPQSVRVLIQLAAAWEALGDKPQAWELVQQAYQIDPFNQLVIDQFRRLKKTQGGPE